LQDDTSSILDATGSTFNAATSLGATQRPPGAAAPPRGDVPSPRSEGALGAGGLQYVSSRLPLPAAYANLQPLLHEYLTTNASDTTSMLSGCELQTLLGAGVPVSQWKSSEFSLTALAGHEEQLIDC
jgi:hypothetical protein